MENTIFVKPKKKEFIVIKPDGKRLRAEGEIVKADVYCGRREMDGEVEINSIVKKGKK